MTERRYFCNSGTNESDMTMMEQLIEGFPAQLKEGLDIGANITIRKHEKDIRKVLICGMGGSGIGGDYVAQILRDEAKVPVLTCKSYDIPAWVDAHTLCIISSYSGNTEESIECLHQAFKTGAKIICISSGGKVQSLAESHDLDFVMLPGGSPSPRACLGYSVTAQLSCLQKSGLISRNSADQIRIASDLLKFEQEAIRTKAERIASGLLSGMAVIYSADRYEPVALRWRQQLHENSKIPAWHHVIPEMNHNEIVGWTQKQEQVSVVILRNKDDHKRNTARMDFTVNLVSNLAARTIEVHSKGNSYTERAFYLSHLGDWVSYYLAVLRKVDPSEIRIIDTLKQTLQNDQF